MAGLPLAVRRSAGFFGDPLLLTIPTIISVITGFRSVGPARSGDLTSTAAIVRPFRSIAMGAACASVTSYFPAQNWCFGKSGQGRATTEDPPGATGGGFTEPGGEGGRIYRVARFSIARPMLMRLSAMTPRPTQRFIPASPL